MDQDTQEATSWLTWVHAVLIVPLIHFWEVRVLLPWEELVTSSIRHAFQETARTVNGVSSWLLSFFNAQHRESLKQAWQHNPWQKWWTQVEDRPNTLNALLAALTQQNQQQEAAGPSGAESSQGPSRRAASTEPTHHAPQRAYSAAGSTHTQPSHRGAASHNTPEAQAVPQRSASVSTTGYSSWSPWAAASVQQAPLNPAPSWQQPTSNGHKASRSDSNQRAGQLPRPRTGSPRTSQAGGVKESLQRPVMFLQHSGMGILDAASARLSRTTGLLEDTRLAVEVHTAKAFASARGYVRAIFGLPPLSVAAGGGSGRAAVAAGAVGQGRRGTAASTGPRVTRASASGFESWDGGDCLDEQWGGGGGGGWQGLEIAAAAGSWSAGAGAGAGAAAHISVTRSRSAHIPLARSASLHRTPPPCSLPGAVPRAPGSAGGAGGGAGGRGGGLRRTTSFSALEEVVAGRREVSVADVIRLAGYPLEVHTCTTPDGYVLCMERIPRHGSRDVVFFLHGLMDTSMSWVSAGVTGSQAFAAWDMGFDVWLANSRCNAPRLHQDPVKPATSPAYWRFSVNELGEMDIGAQLRRVHEVKCEELPYQGGKASRSSVAMFHPGGSLTARSTSPAPPRQATRSLIASSHARPLSRASLPATSASSPVPDPSNLMPAWASRACLAITGAMWGPRAPSATGGKAPSPASHDLFCSPGGGPGRFPLSSSGSDEVEFFDAVGEQQEEMAAAAARAGGAGRRSTGMRAAASDGDLTAAGGGAGAARRASAAAGGLLWQRPTGKDAAVVAGGNGSTGPRQLPDPAAAWQTPVRSASQGSVPAAHAAPIQLPAYGPGPSSHALPESPPSPEAPSTPCPSSPQRSPAPRSTTDTTTNRPAATDGPAIPACTSPVAPSSPRPLSPSPRTPGVKTDSTAAAHGFSTWQVAALAGAAAPVSAMAAAAAAISNMPSFRRATSTSHLHTLDSQLNSLDHISPHLDPDPASPTPHSRTSSPVPLPPHHLNGTSPRPNQPFSTTSTTSTAAPKPGVLPSGNEPYRLRVVAHSLGGMSMLVYLHRMAEQGRAPHVHRLVLLTPAGFHNQLPNVAIPISWLFPLALWVFRTVTWPWWRRVPGWRPALPLYIPTTTVRQLMFKLLADMRQLPSMAELLRLGIKLLFSDDASQWDRALQMPHYSAKAMPAVSMDAVLHMTQCARSHHFRLFDYGSASANRAVYGQPVPPDVADEYWRLGDLPVDLVAGAYDGIIPPSNVRRHYQKMQEAGCKVTYKEFEFGHLDFTFAVKDELKMYLLRALKK